ncbi:MAG: ABC transporter ATP-binding protein [Oenococcus oeni]
MIDFLSAKNLVISFEGKTIINKMNFSVEKGKMTSLLGPSGSGKTTILRAIAGLNKINCGEIFLDGISITKKPINKRNIGMIFQSYALFPNLSVYENVAYGLKIRSKSKQEINQSVNEMLSVVGLSEKRDSFPEDLSGGQKQRVAIARSMVVKPKILLLDEPLSALDAKIRVSLRKQIREFQIKFGITMIFVTHDQNEAMSISDNIIVMSNGKIEQQGTPEKIYSHPKNDFVARFIGNHNILSGEQLNLLTNKNLYLSEEYEYVIRPETISFKRFDNSEKFLTIEATLSKSEILGDVINYQFVSSSITLKVEKLNIFNSLIVGQKIKLFINMKDILQVRRSL